VVQGDDPDGYGGLGASEEQMPEEPILMGAYQEGQEEEEDEEDEDATSSLGYDPLAEQLKDLGLDKDDDDDEEDSSNLRGSGNQRSSPAAGLRTFHSGGGNDDHNQSYDDAGAVGEDSEYNTSSNGHNEYGLQQNVHAHARAEATDEAPADPRVAYSAPQPYGRVAGPPNGYAAATQPQPQPQQRMLSGGTSCSVLRFAPGVLFPGVAAALLTAIRECSRPLPAWWIRADALPRTAATTTGLPTAGALLG
jgi:hypothetical protein